jgi:hypothetical protein
MGKRPGAKYAALQRLDSLMADHEKRSEAKAKAVARGESPFGYSDGRIHSFQSRTDYQKVIMPFIEWCREQHNLRDLAAIDAQADELACLYLLEYLEGKKRDEPYSAWTLTTYRSALRMFFQNSSLTDSITLPPRRQQDIKRSRHPAKRDRQINLDNWRHVINFCLASGLRREELRDLYVREVYQRKSDDQQLVVYVRHGKGGKDREVPVFPGREEGVLSQVQDRPPDAHVFSRISGLLDIHSYRRQFAQDLYEHWSGRPLPPLEGRLHSADLDHDVALQVSRCLGHNRIDIIFAHYIH